MTQISKYLTQRLQLRCICGAEGGIIVRRRDRFNLRFQYKLCLRCGHVRTGNPLTQEAATSFYTSSDYRSMYFPGEEPRDVLLRKSPKPNSRTPLLEFVTRHGGATGTIIEWGCGGGWNLVAFRDAGWSTFGFDFDRHYVDLGRNLLKLDLRQIGPEADASAKLLNPDVILLNHVLEHALDPKALLDRLRTFCDTRAVVVVGVPLLETIKLWRWKPFFHIAHIHYFSSQTLKLVAKQAGFTVIHESVDEGLFVLKIDDGASTAVSKPELASVIRSSAYLTAGFLDSRHRIRSIVRFVLARVGLLEVARQIRLRKRR